MEPYVYEQFAINYECYGDCVASEVIKRFMNTAGHVRWSVNMPADVKYYA